MTVKQKPNFIVVVADDLGFTDLSPFGGEIETPNLHKLALNGLRFTDFHTASACSPTRSMLLSGTDHHIAGLGQMAEFARNYPHLFDGKPGYEGYLNYRVAALSEILEDSGYYTFQSGKWHLGLTEDYWPSKRGFQKSFTLLPGAGNHYKYYPIDEATGGPAAFMAPLFQENGKSLDPYSLPEDYYSSDYFTDKFLEFLGDDKERDQRPFFGFLTYTAPHWPFQAPEEVRAKYKGKYDGGPEVLRRQRLDKALELGIIPDGVIPHEVITQREKAWDELTDKEKKIESRIMETYAAMVDVVDQNLGRVFDRLEKSGEIDNTFILFMSDNGAEGMIMEALPLRNLNFKTALEKDYNNSYENIGKKDSFVWYSDQWAQAATAPAYMYKAWNSEGGIRCPLIIHHPNAIPEENRGNVRHGFATVMDILPTILDLADIPHPGTEYRGRKVVEPKGVSWKKYITGVADFAHDENSVTGWELFAQQAIRKGKWKALFIPKPLGPDRWQLFDLKADPGERIDLAEKEPKVLEELLDYWSQYEAETGLVKFNGEFHNDIQYTPRLVYE